MTLPSGLRALNHADFRVFFGGQAVGLVGGWMQFVAQSWLVLELTDSPFKLGLIGTLNFGPMLLFAVVAGAVADRTPKRRLLLITQAIMAGQAMALTLLVATGRIQYWHVCALALLWGFANTLDLPARQSFVMDMVGKDDVISAVALNSAAFNGARIVGPAVAGVLIAGYGMVWTFLVNCVALLVVIVALLRVRNDGRTACRHATTMAQEIAEGLRYALGVPRIVLILALLFVMSLCAFNFAVVVPLLARDVMRVGPEGFGLLMAALGVGAVAGALALGTFGGSEPPLVALFGAATVAFLALLALGMVAHFWVAAVTLLVLGFAAIVTVTGANTALQLSAPDGMRGRVMSLYQLVFGGVFPIGSFLTGAIAEAAGVAAACLTAGGLGLASLGVIALVQARRAR